MAEDNFQQFNSLTDLFSVGKNLVIAVNDLAQAWKVVQGTQHSDSLAAATTTVVSTSPGRVATVFVTTAGSTAGSIYDSKEASPAASSLIAAIPNVVGSYTVNVPVNYGIVATTGTAQVMTVIFS